MSGSRIEKSLLVELSKAPGTIQQLCERAHGGYQSVDRILRRFRKEGVVAAERLPRRGPGMGRGGPPLLYRLAA